MKVKKVIAVILGITIPVGGVVFGVNAYKSYQYSKLEAEVQPVSYISWGYWGDTETSYGMVTNDSSQEIYLSDSKSVKKVYVAEGDTVSVGDPLIEYDTSELSIEIERKKLDLNILENDIAIAQHALEQYKAAKPVKKDPPELDNKMLEELQKQDELNNMKPEMDENGIYNYITEDAVPYGSSAGTKEDPYVYYCNANAYIYGSFFDSILPTRTEADGKYVRFVVCKRNADGTVMMQQVNVAPKPEGTEEQTETVSNGGSTGENGGGSEAGTGSSGTGTGSSAGTGNGESAGNTQGGTANSTVIEQPIEDTSVAAKEYNGNELPLLYGSEMAWYIFTDIPYTVSLVDQYLQTFYEASANWEEPEGYTAEELATNIEQKEQELKSLDIQRRQMELQLESMRNTAADGMLYATVEGVVKTVGDPEEYNANDGTAFLVVTGEEGLYVRGTISELLLGDVAVGTVVTANSWETGMTFDATITEIADYPTSGNSWGDGNSNVSYYSYTAYIEDSSMLRNGEYLDLSISTNQSETGGLYIEKAYVREEDGKSYVMIADENNCLKKQYVVTGRTIYGSAVEIKSGLTEEDRIAFPYGKNAVEGVAVKDADNMYY